MSGQSVDLWTTESSDAELIAGVRAGESAAFGILFERHGGAAKRVASMYSSVPSDVDDIVSESFARVLKILQEGGGPDLAFRAYLFTVVRRTGLDTIRRAKKTRPDEDMSVHEEAIGYSAASDEPTLTDFEHSIVADAFKSLPERWQVVLWYTEIEKKGPAEVAPLLGLSPNGVAALAYRAREALRQAYLQQHLATTEDAACLAVSDNLAAYVRGGLTKREHAKVQVHVRQCERCEALVAELEDVNRGLRAVIAPLIMGVLGVGALETALPIGGVGAVAAGLHIGAASATHVTFWPGGGGGASAGIPGAAPANSLGASGAAGTGHVGFVSGVGSMATHVTTAISTMFTGTLGAVAATVGVAAIAVAGAGVAGGVSTYHDHGDTPGPTAASIESPQPSESTEPSAAAPLPIPVVSATSGGTPLVDDVAPSVTPAPHDVTPSATPSPHDVAPSATPSPAETPSPDLGDVTVLRGGRVSAVVGDGGVFHVTVADPTIRLRIVNVSGQGSTPIALTFDLPVGLEFVTTTDSHGSAVLNVDGWNCQRWEDPSIATCSGKNLHSGSERTLALPVATTGALSPDATTAVSFWAGSAALVPTTVEP